MMYWAMFGLGALSMLGAVGLYLHIAGLPQGRGYTVEKEWTAAGDRFALVRLEEGFTL